MIIERLRSGQFSSGAERGFPRLIPDLTVLKPAARLCLAVLQPIFNFVFWAPLPPRGSRGRVRTVISSGSRGFWADSGPDPGGNLFLIFIFAPTPLLSQ